MCVIGPNSDVSGLHHIGDVTLPIGARLAGIFLPSFVLRQRCEVTGFFLLESGCSGGMLQADGGSAGLHDGRVGVTAEVVVCDRCVSPASFTPGGLPLNPLPPECCLGLKISNKDILK